MSTTIMNNDTLAMKMLHGHNYKDALVGEHLDDAAQSFDGHEALPNEGTDWGFDLLSSVSWVVWLVIAVLILALIVYWLFRSGLIERTVAPPMDVADNIYEIDFDREMADALQRNDYAALVRLVYLATLRHLDEHGRIVWRIHKTPSEYAVEAGDASLATMTNHFLRVRYGHFEASRSLYEEMLRLQTLVQKGGES